MIDRPRRRFLIQLASAASLLALSGCNFRPKYSYRYRVTIEVDTPQGLRTGSSVWETTTWEGSGIPNNFLRTRVRAEAVAVDLPGGTLFALLRGQDMNVDYAAGVVDGHLSRHPMPGLVMTRDWAEDIRRIKKAMPAFDLDPAEYPLLVRFGDVNDPASVEKVDPANLAATFGPGVRLKRITVALTDDRPKSGGLFELLPWLKNQRGALERCPRGTLISQKPLACRITEGDFSRGQA